MKQLKNYLSILSMLLLLLTFASCTSNTENEYVDLGLPSGIKWATCNVGANSPEDYGDYFAWGETEPKDYYDWSTYKYCNGSYDIMTKYFTDSDYGTVDNKTTLELTDDAAHVNWGGNWRMPTKAEQDELRNTDNCTWEWTTLNGVEGYKVISKKNGNS
ncbi:MAG: T9SS C-terminal target domain-containing protein, partial [Bacteroidales bacterium]|nr:T9SS C-terminal target domain-containing protein [Bacteroidales bacterium]